jgi:prophage tail gpP-like protein
MTDWEAASIVLDDGTQLRHWNEYEINCDILTPCDGWSFTFGSAKEWASTQNLLVPGSKVEIHLGDHKLMTGFVDVVTVSTSRNSGVSINVQGRDILRPLCKATIKPNFRIKGQTVKSMLEQVLKLYYTAPPAIDIDNKSNRTLVGVTGSFAAKDRSAKLQKQIEHLQAQPNEKVIDFVCRHLRRHGLWLWTSADGNIVVSGPTYDQAPSYSIVRKTGTKRVLYKDASYRMDQTDVPSYMEVRGRAETKEWEKTAVRATATNTDANIRHFVEPVYMQHDEATTQDQADAFARQEMTRLRQDERVYTVTAVDHKDRATLQVFMPDTIATVEDEFVGLRESMYVSSVTYRKSISAGTQTELRLVPIGAIQFSDADVAA